MNHSSQSLCHIIELKEFPPAQEHFEWHLRWTACSECHLMAKPCFLLTQLPSKCNRAIHDLMTVFLSYEKKLLLRLQMLVSSGRGIFGVIFLPSIVSLMKWTLNSGSSFQWVHLRDILWHSGEFSGSGNDLRWGDTMPSREDRPGRSSTAAGHSHVGWSQLQASETSGLWLSKDTSAFCGWNKATLS